MGSLKQLLWIIKQDAQLQSKIGIKDEKGNKPD